MIMEKSEMKSSLKDLINFDKVNVLLENFNKATGFVTAILDAEGNVLSKSGWRQICTEFHRKHPETSKKCTISDLKLTGKLTDGEKYHCHNCLNGLVDASVPIIINDEFVGNLFTGQFFLEKPNREFFKKQAIQYGFDEKSYLDALDQVPIVTKSQVNHVMGFLKSMTELISEMTQQSFKQNELYESYKNSEVKLQNLLDNLDAGVVVHAKDTSILYNNSRAAELLGLSDDQIKGKTAFDPEWKFLDKNGLALPLDDYPVNQIIKNEKPLTNMLVAVVRKQKKDQVWLLVNGFPFYDQEGDLKEVIISFVDITEAKNAELELKEKEEKFRSVFEYSPLGKSMTTVDGTLTVNNAFSHMLGYSKEELIHLHWKEITHPDDVENSNQVTQSMINGEIQHAQYKKRYIHKDGHIIWAHVNTALKRDDENNPDYFITSLQDITVQKQIEEELYDSLNREQLQADIVRKAPIAIAFGYPDGRLENCNAAFTALTGYSTEELKAIKWNEVLTPPEWIEIENEALQKLTPKNNSVKYEKEYIHKSGKRVPIELVVSALFDEDHRIIHFIGFIMDITERKEAEAARKTSDEKFKKLIKNAPLSICYVEKDGQISFRNDRFLSVFGYNEQDVPSINEWWLKAYPDEEYRKKVLQNWESAVRFAAETGSDITADTYKITCKNGTERDVVVSGITIHDDLMATLIDITELKLVEKALIESEKRYRKAQAMGHVGNWEYNIKTEEFWGSDEAKRIYGFEKESHLFSTDEVEKCIPDRERVHQTLINLIEKNQEYNIEFDIIKKNSGERRTIRSTAELEKDANSNPLKVTGVVADITELKKHRDHLEELVRERTKDLIAKNKELDNAMKVFVGRELTIRNLQEKIRILQGK